MLLLAAPLLWRPTIVEHTSEDAVDVPQLTFQIECALDLRARHAARDLFIFQNQVAKIQIFFSGAHGVGLHHAIGVFPRNPALN